MLTLRLRIDIYMDHVMIEGQKLARPEGICRSDWMRYWELRSAGKGWL